MFILDTNVVSELRRTRPHGAVLAWISDVDSKDIHISAATVGEIQAGIELTRENDPPKAAELEKWLVEVVLSMNVIAPDVDIFRLWARLMHRQQSHLWDDAMIAATALHRGATVVTRNLRHFRLFDVPTLDPFEPI